MKYFILKSALCVLGLELLQAWQDISWEKDGLRSALIAYKAADVQRRRNQFYELSSEQYVSGRFESWNQSILPSNGIRARKKRFNDPTFRGNPKTREQIWAKNFAHLVSSDMQSVSLVKLLIKITNKYLSKCIPTILYDVHVEQSEYYVMETLFREFPSTYICGRIGLNYTLSNPELLLPSASQCRSYILFLSDVMMTRKVIGPQLTNHVIVVPRSSQWKLQDFLSAKDSRDILNLLVIGESYSFEKSINSEFPYVLYTHELYIDGLGSNRPIVLTSWFNGKFSRPNVNLFPSKIQKGFSGHRFTVSAAHQPPFVFKIISTDGVGNIAIRWDGLEFRLLKTLGNYLNFTFDIKEPVKSYLGSGDAVTDEVQRKQADIGMAGTYVTIERNTMSEMSVAHSTDCAAFVTLMSSSLPRYRAILGPFQWPVWVALTFVYLLAIFPLAFSDKLSLRHLLGNWTEIENMFWYVFGTFTNSLTFTGENSWSKTKKTSTRILIGIYWVFTIIITSCYTGSIIAFVTMPVVPHTIDTVSQLQSGFFRFVTLDRGGWERWFLNSSDRQVEKMINRLKFVSSIEEGIRNVTGAFLISYAFIGSKAELEYLVQSNFSEESSHKRYSLHVSKQCFSLFGVSYVFQLNSVHRDKINSALLYMQQAGLLSKISKDVSWDIQKTKDGRYRQASVGKTLRVPTGGEKGLTLGDTEGMFLLMGVGYLIGAAVLISEWVGGCTNKCREIIKARKTRLLSTDSSVPQSNPSSANQNSLRKRRRPSGKEYSLMDVTESSSVNAFTPHEPDVASIASMVSTESNHHCSLTDGIQNVSASTLQDLYDGPSHGHSTIIYIDGKIMSEDEARRYAANEKKHKHHSSLSSVVEHEVSRLFSYLDDLGSIQGNPEKQHHHHHHQKKQSIEVTADVNHPEEKVIGSRTARAKSLEAPFGEKLFH